MRDLKKELERFIKYFDEADRGLSQVEYSELEVGFQAAVIN